MLMMSTLAKRRAAPVRSPAWAIAVARLVSNRASRATRASFRQPEHPGIHSPDGLSCSYAGDPRCGCPVACSAPDRVAVLASWPAA